MARFLACLAVWAVATAAPAETNLVDNPSFEEDADGDRVPDGWRFSGDGNVVQKLTLDAGRDGRRCARLACTEFTAVTSASHAMLCQADVPVKRGTNYRLAFWARAEGIAGDVVSVALSDTSAWENCGLQAAFAPSPDWKRYEFIFQATRDCPKASRFQIWFGSTGTLWMDDVEFVEGDRDLYRPGEVIPAAGNVNLVPNASFECGTVGWGSIALDRTVHWGGNMNRLFGEPDSSQAFHGRTSLKIALSPESRPVSYFDYYDLSRQPILAPMAANIGFLEVEPGKRHTLSVYMKADRAGTPAVLGIRQFQAGGSEETVRLSTDWQRYTLSFTPASRWCYVMAGPDLRAKRDNSDVPDRATVWLDAVQLEEAEAASGFGTRRPVEFGLWTDRVGNVFEWNDPLTFRFRITGDRPTEDLPPTIEFHLLDFFDREVWSGRKEVRLTEDGSGRGAWFDGELTVEGSPQYRGAMRMRAKLTAGEIVSERAIRLAAIDVYKGGDSRFGMNHAYPWPHLLDLSRKAGLVWVRDWSCKWQEVEPERDRFDFTETDYQIDRPLEHGLRVLGLLPFPSAHWSSAAPADYDLTGGYVSRREHVAYASADEGAFANYVGKTVAHYAGRVTWWQVFNEPVFTSYSLPRKFGYGGADYARWTKVFAQSARRANPECRVLAGLGALSQGQIMEDWRQFIEAGGLEPVDAVDIHHYPGLHPPEYIEPALQQLVELMEKRGARRPLWLTEYGYYADDEPSSVPMPNSGFDILLADEQQQAAYVVRWTTIMLAGGVEKIFYHAGTCDAVDRDSVQGIFYEYAGCPHKIYAAQAVMAQLFTPSCRFLRRLELGDGIRGYLFRDGGRTIAVVWAPKSAGAGTLRLANDKLQLWDIMGRPQAARQFTPGGTPVYLIGDGLPDAANLFTVFD